MPQTLAEATAELTAAREAYTAAMKAASFSVGDYTVTAQSLDALQRAVTVAERKVANLQTPNTKSMFARGQWAG